jgi:hypothetical protein
VKLQRALRLETDGNCNQATGRPQWPSLAMSTMRRCDVRGALLCFALLCFATPVLSSLPSVNQVGRLPAPSDPAAFWVGAGGDFLQGLQTLQGDYGHKVFVVRLPFSFLAKAIKLNHCTGGSTLTPSAH